LLANTALPETARSQLEVILRNAERLQHLIRDMMELSRIESRRVPLHPAEVDLSRLTRTLLRDMEPRLRQRALDAQVVGDDDNVPVWADRRAVEQVLTNLLDNAIKYTDPGGRIAVEIAPSAEAVRVSVVDTGIGISPESLGRIFERFYRVDKARSRALGGTGLGLAIVKHLVQAMGGKIYVESEPGRGSAFRFTLPRADRRRT
jgi:two-component system phosphate regulon sensor histidine kinase PhoR